MNLHRSGVTDADVARTLPGDSLVPDAAAVIDRAGVLPAGVDVVWPWLLQLGKERGGWYFPRWVERWIPLQRRGLRVLDPALLEVQVGERVPDWGPGTPLFEVASLDPERSLVMLSARDKTAGHTWPAGPPPWGDEVMVFSWALCLEPLGEHACRLHVRLRFRRAGRVLGTVGAVFDWVTVALMLRGLAERVQAVR